MPPCACPAAPNTASARWSTSSATTATGPVALATLGRAEPAPAQVPRADHGDAQARRASSRTTLGAHGGYALAADPATVSVGRVIRLLDGALAPLGCVSLRYYEPCSCPDEATCPLRDVMIDVRDAMLEILDKETLAELAARQGRASIDPRGRHADALAGFDPSVAKGPFEGQRASADTYRMRARTYRRHHCG